jgi:dienelactone hydrolase
MRPPVRPIVRLTCALALLALPAAAGAGARIDPIAGAETLGLACAPATSADGVEYTRCTGEISSFDGVGLDTDLSLPKDQKPPYPTILMLHGWSQDKTAWQSPTRDGGTNPDKFHWNNVWFVSKGYAVVNYTARGFKESCGQLDAEADCVFPPNRAWTHLADRRWETKDSQHILGLLVDERIADPARLASTGGSYGGGQSWLLATSLPWTSPGGHAGLQLAAAVAKYPWTDLLNSLVPNGRASDDVNQQPSHEQPFGIPKESYIDGLYAAGRTFGEGRYNMSDPSEFHSHLDTQFGRVQAGEPYEPDPVIDLLAAEYRHKSPYHADQYFAAISAGTIHPVPVFSIQGWTDPLFPAIETLQMYRRLKAADPEYPIDMAFGDLGHSNAQNPPYQWEHINTQGNQFLNSFVLGQGQSTPTTHALAFVTHCPEAEGPKPTLEGTSWDQMAEGRVTATGAGSRTTTSSPPDPEELQTDPILQMDTCLTNGTSAKPGTWTWEVGNDGFTLLGLPEVKVAYAMTGADATVAFKLWDLPPAGDKVMVDRGVYRLSVAGGDPVNDTIDLDLFGNAWQFEPGHRIQLQISQTDAAYLRPDNLPSSITWSNPQLTLPVRQGFDLALAGV